MDSVFLRITETNGCEQVTLSKPVLNREKLFLRRPQSRCIEQSSR